MVGNWLKRLTALAFFFTCALNVLAVVNLGIARDQRAQALHYHVWSSRVTYVKDTSRFSNDELYALAKVAYDEMEALWETDIIDEWKRPAMMAAMAVGNDVYFSSSIKGSGDKKTKDEDGKHVGLSFIYDYNELKKNGRDDRSHVVSQKLKACQLALFEKDDTTAPRHNSHASCAEIMVLHKVGFFLCAYKYRGLISYSFTTPSRTRILTRSRSELLPTVGQEELSEPSLAVSELILPFVTWTLLTSQIQPRSLAVAEKHGVASRLWHMFVT